MPSLRVVSLQHLALGRAIRDQRKRLGLSQDTLALRAGIDATYLSGVENGKRNPGWHIVTRLAEELDLSLPTLTYRAELIAKAEAERGW